MLGGGGVIALYGIGCFIACVVIAISKVWPRGCRR